MTANGAHMKMLCDGDINVDGITKKWQCNKWYIKSESYTRNEAEAFQLHTSNVGWLVHGPNKTRRAFSHEDHKPIIFDRVLEAGNSVLLVAKMVIKNPEEVNTAIMNGRQSKQYFHRVTGHAGHHLMDATAKYTRLT